MERPANSRRPSSSLYPPRRRRLPTSMSFGPEGVKCCMNAAVLADLCDYTRLTEQLGDDAAAEMAVALGAIATSVAQRHAAVS